MSQENEDPLSEFDFPVRYPDEGFTDKHAFAFSSLEADTMIIGKSFRAKVFLANRKLVYNEGDSIVPLIKYSYGDSTSIWDMRKISVPAEVANDTGYVKFEVQDDDLKKGQTKKKVFYAFLTVPLPSKDSLFILRHDFIVRKK